jgi:molybdopterin-guanine dinucleotide biosynthesis protein A
MNPTETAWRAVVLAGERPGGDPLARGLGVARKALIPIAGRAMVEHVVAALRATAAVRSIAISGLEPSALATLPSLAGIETSPSGPTPSASVLAALDAPGGLPLVVTTADHPLLPAETIAAFLRSAGALGADVAAGVVDAATVRRRFPESRRTYVRFRGRSLTGANLFAFTTPAARHVAEAWGAIERDRKRPWRMVRRLGLPTLLRFLAGRLSPEDAVARVSRELGARIELVWLEDALAAVDVDRADDLALAAKLLGPDL